MTKLIKALIAITITLSVLYCGIWFGTAHFINNALSELQEDSHITFNPTPNNVSGFPFWPKLIYTGKITTPSFAIETKNMSMTGMVQIDQVKLNLAFPSGFKIADHYTRKSHKFDKGHIKLTAQYPLPLGDDKKAMRQWQKDNGEIHISSMYLKKNKTQITGSGIVGLDRDLQIQGKIYLSIQGYQDLLGELNKAGLISNKHVGLAQNILGSLFGGTQAETKEKTFKTPLIIKNRNIYIGPIKIAKLQKIKWKD
ncbi:MAG: DUF2125 domain-containing protein [Alphaproteobacteria bacterium]|nr:DUF2125 domain-containing protein [Alphaproteobacteria bacterium]